MIGNIAERRINRGHLIQQGFVVEGSVPNVTGVIVRNEGRTVESTVHPVIVRTKTETGDESVITVLKPPKETMRQLGVSNRNGINHDSQKPVVETVIGTPKWMHEYQPGTGLRGHTPHDIDELFDYKAGGPAPIKPLTVVFMRQR